MCIDILLYITKHKHLYAVIQMTNSAQDFQNYFSCLSMHMSGWKKIGNFFSPFSSMFI